MQKEKINKRNREPGKEVQKQKENSSWCDCRQSVELRPRSKRVQTLIAQLRSLLD